MDVTNDLNRTRRSFLKLSVLAGGGLVLGLDLNRSIAMKSAVQSWQPNAWLQIGPDDIITITVAESEMGQGVLTAMPMLVAEELEADWKQIRVMQAPVAPIYGWQGTGGSTSVRQGWQTMREAGAAAQAMLLAAAAQQWQVKPDACQARNSVVYHRPTGRCISYGALAEHAARMPLPTSIRLKDPSDFRIIGKSMPRFDTPSKVNGSAIFGADVRLPGMLYSTIAHSPMHGGRLANIQASAAMAVHGVRHVVPLETAVAVVADSYWAAHTGLHALIIEWDPGSKTELSSATIHHHYHAALQKTGEIVRRHNNSAAASRNVKRDIEAVYETPFQAHATMEPMCCTAEVRGNNCTLWVPTQQPTGLQRAVARLMSGKRDPGIAELQRVVVHTTLLGGGFGRRNLHDFALEAVLISRAVKAPVKLIWSREEDMQHDYYHPATVHRLRAGLDALGRPVTWEHRQVGSPYTDGANVIPYAVASQQLEIVKSDFGIPVGPWRSVSHAYTAYAVECFVDELAAAAGKDPYAYRASLITEPRLRTVLELAADKGRWGKQLPTGHYLGIAAHASFGSYVAQVVELSVNRRAGIRVHRVVAAVDCGVVINPDTVKAQMEGSIVFGLTAALKGKITIQNGRTVQSNFHDYPLLRINEMPAIDIYLVDSLAAPGGIGEPGVPPLAPAVANAVHAAIGKRIRHLPITPDDLH